MASPAAGENGAQSDSKDQISFRFCSECSNMLYPKEDIERKKLQFVCRTCQYSEEATSTCIFRNVLSTVAGETAGVTQDVGSDPTVGDPGSSDSPSFPPDDPGGTRDDEQEEDNQEEGQEQGNGENDSEDDEYGEDNSDSSSDSSSSSDRPVDGDDSGYTSDIDWEQTRQLLLAWGLQRCVEALFGNGFGFNQ